MPNHEERTIVLGTLHGSHAWGMHNEDSDEDRWYVYADDPRDILNGTASSRSFNDHGDEIDVTYHEVGKCIEQILKGNYNFIEGVLSPAIIETTPMGLDLRKLVEENPSRAIFHSFMGIATSNYKRYVRPGYDTSEKKIRQITRILEGGIHYLETGEMRFRPPQHSHIEDIKRLSEEMEKVYEWSPLPERPDEAPFRDWLLRLRLEML